MRIGRRATMTMLGLGALALGTTAALAHHGWSGYLDDDFELTGVVETVELGQPHGLLEVSADDGVWDVVLGPAYRNRRAGLTDGAVEAGDTVTALGKRHRDPERREMKAERLVVGDKTYDIYPDRL